LLAVVSARFQELDWRQTTLGEISLRRRWDPVLDKEVHEIKLGDKFLMSSLFTHAEEELARLALAGIPGGSPWGVVVGGLGLGYTAEAVLADPGVGSLLVVEALDIVIEWHKRQLIPAGAGLVADPRCRLVHGDFFAMLASAAGLDPEQPGRRFHTIIVDIDHSPEHVLHPSHVDFYQPVGLRRLIDQLHPGGVFALWSNDPPAEGFATALAEVFPAVSAEIVRFPNPLQGRDSANTVYLAQAA
jgi:spermidine synthase